MLEKLKNLKIKHTELGEKLMDSSLLSNQKEYAKIAKEYKNLQNISDLYDKFLKIETNLKSDETALKSETDAEIIEMLETEISEFKDTLNQMEEQAKILLLPKDENDDKNVILEIRAGAGGEEASLFGAEILRMYLKYSEQKRFKVEIIEIDETELGGIKNATLLISGEGAFAKFKYESGVHRVQRVPETETQGRVHTSTITVAVLPENEDVDVEINDKDVRIDIYRSSGAGGQHVNKTESAVRLTHLPTGIVVACQDERSQIQNREKAYQVLKSKLYDYYKQLHDAEYADRRKIQVGTGDRSERIRTYNYPQSRVTDHRINLTIYSLTNFLNGDVEEMITALEIADQKAKLESSTF